MTKLTPTIGFASVLCVLLSANSALAVSDRGTFGDRDDLLRFLNGKSPERYGIVTGSCSVPSSELKPDWIYVLLPSSKGHGFLAELTPDPPYPPAWVNMGKLYLSKGKVSVQDHMGGDGVQAVLESAGRWIIRHRLQVAKTYAQALAKPPVLSCPSEVSMMEWPYRHRGKSRPGHSPH